MASIVSYNTELVATLESLRDQREDLHRSILRDEEEKGRIQKVRGTRCGAFARRLLPPPAQLPPPARRPLSSTTGRRRRAAEYHEYPCLARPPLLSCVARSVHPCACRS
jgi:hypothetical protein